ncbi:hypothetical protein SLS62_004110 [Diatrype stigma]|uniref:RING-type domain-containing protein n=1 Tax=Diatrype stigma TaxID=117547 RepID=A0AAN9YQX1_9PEZI
MATTTCKACDDPLILEIQDDDEDTGAGSSSAPQSVPDDLELPCGCHFHWQCLLDQAAEVATSLKCPSCGSPLATTNTSASASIVTRYTSEGGVDADLDILPALAEEAYLAANPAARPARAFHVMCAEGDAEGIVDLLRDADSNPSSNEEEEEPSMPVPRLLRYQDPLAHGKSGLHLAVERGQEEVVWLLLWVASALPARAFPEAAVRGALALGLQQRPGTAPAEDIRALTDDRGRTAEAVATEIGAGGPWAAVLPAGVLHPGNC